MGFFRTPRFIRRYFRRNFPEISVFKAIETKKKLSLLYALVAWNIFGYVVYRMVKDKNSGANVNNEPWHGNKVMNMENVKHHKININVFGSKKAQEEPETSN